MRSSRPREHSDIAVLVAWTILAIVVACARREFIGDGLKHIGDAAAGIWRLGEPRWLLFPALLTAWVSLGQGLGAGPALTHTIGLFLALDVVSGVIFLVALRELLRHMQVPPGRRALAVALAGACGPLFELSTNVAEPMPAVALAMLGLLIAGRAREDTDLSWHAVAGGALICLAGLVYQGMILALGFLPAVMPARARLRARTLAVIAAVAVALWGGAVVALASASSSPIGATIVRFTKNGDNDLYARWVKSSSNTPRLVAVAVGPAAGISTPPRFTGLRAVLEGVRRGDAVALAQVLALATGSLVFWVLLVTTVTLRRGWLVAALCAVLILPLLRPSQYSYLKFYALLPIFVALSAARLKGLVTAALLCLLLTVNGLFIVRSVSDGRALFDERARAYETAGTDDCWVTAAWIPAAPQIWPGRSCSLLGTLASGRGSSMEELMAEQRASLERCLEWCYCDARSVWTDDMTTRRRDRIRELAGYFQASELVNDRLLWAETGGVAVLRGQVASDVLRFEEGARREACGSLRQRTRPEDRDHLERINP